MWRTKLSFRRYKCIHERDRIQLKLRECRNSIRKIKWASIGIEADYNYLRELSYGERGVLKYIINAKLINKVLEIYKH